MLGVLGLRRDDVRLAAAGIDGALIASAIGGVIWVMTGAGTGSAEALPFWTPAIGAAVRQVAFGVITGVYLWQRLQQRAR